MTEPVIPTRTEIDRLRLYEEIRKPRSEPTNPETINDLQEIYEALIRGLRTDLTPEQREEAIRIGRIEFKSAGAIRKR